MTEQQALPRTEALKYVATWKSELDLRQKEIYSRLFSGAMGGVATIVLSSGLGVDKLSEAGWLIRLTLGLALFLLLLCAGNIMNCFRIAVNGQLALLNIERKLTLDLSENVAISDLEALNHNLCEAVSSVEQYYRYSYTCMLLAVLCGSTTFIITLLRA